MSPCLGLKILQKKMNYVLKLVYNPKPSVHGFVQNNNVYTNASEHVGKQYVINIDIKDFFPSINFGRVYGLFKKSPFNFNREVAACLARLCCYNNMLPQGAPTSPIISNMICYKLDNSLQTYSKSNRYYYSRYADDITISTTLKRISPQLVEELQAIIKSNGFIINDEKTRILSQYKRQEVTGVIVNEKANLTRKYIRNLRALIYSWENDGLKIASKKHYCLDNYEHKFRCYVLGKIQYLKMIIGKDNPIFIRLAKRYNTLISEEYFKVNESDEERVFYENNTWVIKGDNNQGTAFFLDGYGLITCYHVINADRDNFIWTYRCNQPDKKYLVEIIKENKASDIAILKAIGYSFDYGTGFIKGNSKYIKEHGENIVVVGFPNYHREDDCSVIQPGITIGRKKGFFPNRYLVSCKIAHGNSGGPVFDKDHKVIGIVLTGSKSLDDEDITIDHGFVPIEVLDVINDT